MRDSHPKQKYQVLPWGPNVVMQTETVALMSPHDLFRKPFMMPLVDQDWVRFSCDSVLWFALFCVFIWFALTSAQEAFNVEQAKLEAIAAGRLRDDDDPV